jgi:hypothetical protein
MSGHGRLICESCGTTISRCRCLNHNSVKLSVCESCQQSKPSLQADLTRLQDTVNSIRDLDFELIVEDAIGSMVTNQPPDGGVEAIVAVVGATIEDQINKIIYDGTNQPIHNTEDNNGN